MAKHPEPRPPSSSPIGPALALIERRLAEPLSLNELAAAAGLSPFHFARLFAAVIGDSPIAYHRRRRLDVAAERLAADPGLRLVDLALDTGFESQEAFTRAFARTFGVPPGRYRRNRTNIVAMGEETMNPTIDLATDLVMDEQLHERPAFRVAGLTGSFDRTSLPQLPGLWDRFVPRLPLQGQLGGECYGICWSTTPEQPFHYMAAAALRDDAEVPAGLDLREIPAQTYVVFRWPVGPGPFQPQIVPVVQEIWGGRIPTSGLTPSGGPDFELYAADLRPGVDKGWMEYWIPVEP